MCLFVFLFGSGLPPIETPEPRVKPQVRPQVKPQGNPQAKQQSKKQQFKGRANKKPREQTAAPVWVEGRSDDGSTYYYNTITGGEDRLKTPRRNCPVYRNIYSYFCTSDSF